MKFSLLLLVGFVAFAAAQNAAEESKEGIFKIPPFFGKLVKDQLKELAKHVGKVVIDKAKDLLTDGLKLQPTKDVQDALQAEPSSEGIFYHTSDLILKKANQLAAEAEAENPSHEGIVTNFGNFHKIVEAEEAIQIRYNKTINVEGVSHEGILGGLGGWAIRGIGGLIGGKFGNVISTAGDVIGSLFFAAPSPVSTEGIAEDPSHEGVISTAGKILLRGTSEISSGILRGVFDTLDKVIGNIFLSRGHFNGYSSIQAPANEIFKKARYRINRYHKHPEVQVCIVAAENNFTQLFDEYVNNGRGCVSVGHKASRKIFTHVEDIVLDAVKRVEDAHRETSNCFDQEAEDDRVVCVNVTVPAQIEEHRKKIFHYGNDLAAYVKQFSDVNTAFDVCLVGHLGHVRREIYHIVDDFHYCVARQRYQAQPGAMLRAQPDGGLRDPPGPGAMLRAQPDGGLRDPPGPGAMLRAPAAALKAQPRDKLRSEIRSQLSAPA